MLGLGAVLAPFTGGLSLAYGATHLAVGAAYDTFGVGENQKTDAQKAAQDQLKQANKEAKEAHLNEVREWEKDQEIRRLEEKLAQLKNK